MGVQLVLSHSVGIHIEIFDNSVQRRAFGGRRKEVTVVRELHNEELHDFTAPRNGRAIELW